jgi:hypothetical protein
MRSIKLVRLQRTQRNSMFSGKRSLQGRCRLRVKNGNVRARAARPFYPHMQTHAPQQASLARASRALHRFGTNAHGQFGSIATEMGCPRYVRFTDAFLLAPHQDRRHLSEGFGESPLVSRPRGRLNGARIHTLEFSKSSEDLR